MIEYLKLKTKHLSDSKRPKNNSARYEKDIKKYFSEDYFEAREKFRNATKNLITWSEKIEDGLTVDFAFSDSGKDKLIIIVSGVHGVEGYAGSALQIYYMDKIFSQFKNSFSVLLIHAYNPYGFRNNRRVNESNVDLNRNCLTNYKSDGAVDSKFKELFLKHKKIFSPGCPRKNNLIEESKYSVVLAKVLLKHGIEGAIQAGSLGQNLYPEGVGFIGLREEKSTKIFKETIDKFTRNYKKTILLDIHTGLGKRNSISSYCENPENSPEFISMKSVFKNLKSRKLSRISSLAHSGSITDYFYNNSKSATTISIIMEIGTVSHLSSALSLKALSSANLQENQITHFGPKAKLEKARLKLKRLYFPNSKRHRKLILSKSGKILRVLSGQIELL